MFQTSSPKVGRNFKKDPTVYRTLPLGCLPRMSVSVCLQTASVSLPLHRTCPLLPFSRNGNPFGCPSLWFLSHLSYPINYQVLLVVTHYVCVSLLHSPWTHCHTPVQATLISSCAYLDSWLVPLLPVLPPSVLFSTVKSEIRHQTLDRFMPSPCVKPSLISIYLRQHKEQNFNIIYNSFPS